MKAALAASKHVPKLRGVSLTRQSVRTQVRLSVCMSNARTHAQEEQSFRSLVYILFCQLVLSTQITGRVIRSIGSLQHRRKSPNPFRLFSRVQGNCRTAACLNLEQPSEVRLLPYTKNRIMWRCVLDAKGHREKNSSG